MVVRELAEKAPPYCSDLFRWTFLVGFMEGRYVLHGTSVSGSDTRSEVVAMCVGDIGQGNGLQVDPTKIDPKDFMGHEGFGCDCPVHEIDVVFSLCWEDTDVGNGERSINCG